MKIYERFFQSENSKGEKKRKECEFKRRKEKKRTFDNIFERHLR